jgi:hypothetical protein
LWILAVLASPTLADAAATGSAPVVVLLGKGEDDEASESWLRVEGELLADGFRVEPVRPSPGTAAHGDIVHDRCIASRTLVTAGLFIDETSGEVEMILCDPVSRREAVRRTSATRLSDEDGPVAFARHTVDLLRAGLLDFTMEPLRVARRPPPEHPVLATSAALPDRRESHPGWALEAGVGVLAGFGGVDASIIPLMRLRRAFASWFQLRATGAALGTVPTVTTARGNATVMQAFGLAEATFTLAPSMWLKPFIGGGAGFYTAAVSGTASPPYGARDARDLAFALDAGIGVAPWITSSLSIGLETHMMCALPPMAVRFIDTDAAQLGPPMLLVTLSFAGWI